MGEALAAILSIITSKLFGKIIRIGLIAIVSVFVIYVLSVLPIIVMGLYIILALLNVIYILAD